MFCFCQYELQAGVGAGGSITAALQSELSPGISTARTRVVYRALGAESRFTKSSWTFEILPAAGTVVAITTAR